MVVDKHRNITLDCSSGGFPKPNIKWTHNSKPLKESSRVIFDGSGSLTLINAIGLDTGTYLCNVDSEAGHLSRSIQLVVRGTVFHIFLVSVEFSNYVLFRI